MNGGDGYRALADPTRRRILGLLQEGDLPAGAIADQFDIAWPSVSRHLAVLAAAGLVTARRQGQHVVYSLVPSALMEIVGELADLARPRPRRRRASKRS